MLIVRGNDHQGRVDRLIHGGGLHANVVTTRVTRVGDSMTEAIKTEELELAKP